MIDGYLKALREHRDELLKLSAMLEDHERNLERHRADLLAATDGIRTDIEELLK